MATIEVDQVIDPATGSVITEIPSASADDVAHAVDVAATAFPSWSSTTPRERAEMLHAIADGIEARATELGDLESRNAGKPITAMPEEIDMCVDTLRFFAGSARTMDGRAAGEYLEDHTSFVRRDPVGVVAAITPWNYPLMMASWKVGPALAAGNTLVLKPSELTPLTTILLGEIAAEVLPAGSDAGRVRTGCDHRCRARRRPTRRAHLVHRIREHRPRDRHAARRTTSPASTSSSAARHPSSCSMTRISTRSSKQSSWRGTGTRARTAPRRVGCSPAPGSTTTSSTASSRQLGRSPSVTHATRRPSSVR